MNDDKFNIQPKEKSQNKDKKCCSQNCGCHDREDNCEGDLWIWLVIFIIFLLAAIILF